MNRVGKPNWKYIISYISPRAILKETFTANFSGVLPEHPSVRPKSDIYTPKQDDENPRPFHMGVPPGMCIKSFVYRLSHVSHLETDSQRFDLVLLAFPSFHSVDLLSVFRNVKIQRRDGNNNVA